MSAPARLFFQLGSLRVYPELRELRRGSQRLAITDPAFALLSSLLQSVGQSLQRADLLATLDKSIDGLDELSAHRRSKLLRSYMDELQSLLGQADDGLAWLESLPRRGWRLRSPIQSAASAPVTAQSKLTERISSGSSASLSGTSVALTGRARHGGLKAGSHFGRYLIVSLLGSGGMGKVYLARDLQLDRKVALKLLPHKYTRNVEWLRRFIREARAVSALNHPNILTIHDVAEIDSQHVIATEYIEGQTLRTLMVGARLDTERCLQIAIQLAGALVAAHAAQLVHRDIKPENIMIRPDGYLKLLDFGLAKPTQANGGAGQLKTVPGIILGTASYMSPEQARGQNVDTRSDIFSLGVLLYEMLTGVQPFAGATLPDTVARILERDPPPLSKHVGQVPMELQRIVLKTLAKDRELRYSSVAQLHHELQNLQQELQLRARLGANRVESEALAAVLEGGAVPVASGYSTSSAGYTEAELQLPEVSYARSGEVNIAYQVIGEGPLDLVFVMGWVSHLEYFWAEPGLARFLRRLAEFARVILFDKRGTGLSDRVPLDQLPTLEQRMDDVRAVMEAVGSERAVLCGVSEGGPMCGLFAATYPERTTALVMVGSYARRLRCEDYPWGPDVAERDAFLDVILAQWGGPVGLEERAPSVAADPAFRRWWAAYLRRGASPAAAVALTRMNSEIDIRQILPSIRVPTLVVHRSGDRCLKIGEGRYLAEHIPGAKLAELPGIDHLPFVGDQEQILDEIEEFLTGVRHASGVDRILATVLVARTSEASDGLRTEATLSQHNLFFSKEIELFKGQPVEISDKRVLATFDGPARAIRAACAIRASAERLNIGMQIGLHTGECDVLGERIGGTAIRIAQHVADHSTTGQILVSSTVKDLVAGSGIRFSEPSQYLLPGGLGDWRLFGVER